jgi:L-alanine-DL-glutamate epimerase-like enolase superfamily enzyme
LPSASTSTPTTPAESSSLTTTDCLLFVRLHTDDGRVGLGEAFFGTQTVESYLHESVAEVLLATEDPTPEAMAQKLERPLPEIVDGHVSATSAAGHGVKLRAGQAESDQVERRVSGP